MKINREVAKQALLTGQPLKQVINRCVGKTTQAICSAVAESYNRLGERVLVDDPDVYKLNDNRWLAFRVNDFIERNDLNKIQVICKGNGQVYLVNTFAENLT